MRVVDEDDVEAVTDDRPVEPDRSHVSAAVRLPLLLSRYLAEPAARFHVDRARTRYLALRSPLLRAREEDAHPRPL